MGESELEDALLDKLQEFLMELGHGFCFEARQKRVLIGDTHCFIDLYPSTNSSCPRRRRYSTFWKKNYKK